MPISINLPRPLGPWAYALPRLALGLVFVYAGAVKLLDPYSFGVVIARYGLLPEPLLWPAALGLPALEVLAGLGLLLDLRGSLAVVSGLLVMFAVVLWFGVLQGLDIDCGCFSSDELAEHDGLRQALSRDLAMLAVAIHLYIWRWRRGPHRDRRGWRLRWNPSPVKEEFSG